MARSGSSTVSTGRKTFSGWPSGANQQAQSITYAVTRPGWMWRGALKPGATSTIAVVISELEFGTSVLLMMVRLIGEGVSGGFFGGSSASATAQLASKAITAMHVLAMVPLRLRHFPVAS